MGDSGGEPTPAASSNSSNPVDELQCTICLSAQFSQECRINGCNHAFCFICISEWVCQSLRPSCPMCRHDVDKIFYDFAEQQDGQKEIGIKEFRSGHMSLTPSDRVQLLGERRLVVRNLMHSYKVAGLLSSEITAIEDSKEPDEILKAALIELATIITEHIQKAEISLVDLRTDHARKNKSVVFDSLTFRRMIYSKKIKVKYPDQKRPKLQPDDLSKEPDRFRNVITSFLIAEFDAIPYQNQPELAGHKWRTKFLGNLDSVQKQNYATQIYDLMLVSPTGNESFQKELNEILSPVSSTHIRLLDDHLEAIIAIEKTEIDKFYNEVYYDSVYNSFSQNFFDYNAMITMRDDPQSRFEAIFSQIHRDMNPVEWLDPYSARVMRQTSNAVASDRATNNGDASSDSSDSSEERVSTPRPDEDSRVHTFARAYFEHMFDLPDPTGPLMTNFRRVREMRRNQRMEGESNLTGQTTRTLPMTEQADDSRTHMRLRSSARRERDAAERAAQAAADRRPASRRGTVRSELFRRLRALEEQSNDITNILRSGPREDTGSSNSRFSTAPMPGGTESTSRMIADFPTFGPTYTAAAWRGEGSILARLEAIRNGSRASPPPYEASYQSSLRRSARRRLEEYSNIRIITLDMDDDESPEPVQTSSETRPMEPAVANSGQESIRSADPDVTSIALRTRSARRREMGETGQPSSSNDGPPPKRSTNSRRDGR